MNNFITCSLYLYSRIFFYFYLKERGKHEKNSLIVNFRAFCCRIFLLARFGGKTAVKGGAWNSKRADCRTEYRNEGRSPNFGYDNVGFRIIREK